MNCNKEMHENLCKYENELMCPYFCIILERLKKPKDIKCCYYPIIEYNNEMNVCKTCGIVDGYENAAI